MTDIAPHDPGDIDVLSLARTMIRHDTSHNGEGADTLPLARVMERVWRHAGVETEIVPTPKPGNVHFLARIRGTGDRPPLLVLSHSDVVPVQREAWQRDPFAAEVADGFLWGRGSLDMKGAGAAFTSALLRHVRAGARFDRDIVFLSDCDEEGGWYGTRWLTDHHWDKVDVGAVLTEGGWTLAHPDGTSPMLASMSCVDRAFGAIRLSAEATATHSSRPLPDSAIARLAAAVDAVARARTPVTLTPLNRRYFATLARATHDLAWAGAIRRLLDADEAGDQGKLDAAGDEVTRASPYPGLHNAMLRATIAFVAQDGGLRANVIPRRATALLQLRFTPGGQSPQDLISHVDELVADHPGIRAELVGPPGESREQTFARWNRDWNVRPSPWDSDVCAAWIDAAAAVYPGTPTTPAMFEAGTSGKPWQDRGIPLYGIYPYVVDHATLTAMHGDNERVGVHALRQGADLLHRMFGAFVVRG